MGRSIQQRLYSHRLNRQMDSKLVCSFTDLMFRGNTKGAIRLLTNKGQGKVLRLEDIATDGQTVLETLRGKHPSSQPCSVDALITSDADPSTVHPVIYEAIDAHCIR